MIPDRRSSLDEVRALYARMMAAESNSADGRIEQAFRQVPREAFLGPGPWTVIVNGRCLETPNADPAHVYQNVLVALDAEKGINNGEPSLHAAWIGAVSPQPGETVSHIGAGTGYYTAILALLVAPGGRVEAFEIEADLAERARENLRPYEGVSVTPGDATVLPLPASDIIYVNAGVVVPPAGWLKALRPGGRLIFPWQPRGVNGLTLLITRADAGFDVRPLMGVRFIPCVGASEAGQSLKAPRSGEARGIRSAWLTGDREPDETAVAIFADIWFSAAPVDAHPGGRHDEGREKT